MEVYDILQIVVCVFFVVFGIVVVPYIKAATDKEKLNKWKSLAQTAVNCAEMVLSGGKVKKEWAVNFLNGMINKNGTVLTLDQISALVEAAVMELKIAEGLNK